jgi:hypothetical protein
MPHSSAENYAAYKDADHQLMKCRDQKDASTRTEAGRLYPELRRTAGLPAN